MATWRHFELGARFRKLAGGGEERVGLDRLSGMPVTLRLYPHPPAGASLPQAVAGPAPHLAQPVELDSEEGEAIVARELAFGPSLEDLMRLGPQPGLVVSALLRQLLEGLAQLHQTGRTHLRLSPDAVRFDLLVGVLKITDLEQALFETAPPEELIPRYLEPEVRSAAGRPGNDIYSVGRIGEALLRGGAPLGPGGRRWNGAWGRTGPALGLHPALPVAIPHGAAAGRGRGVGAARAARAAAGSGAHAAAEWIRPRSRSGAA